LEPKDVKGTAVPTKENLRDWLTVLDESLADDVRVPEQQNILAVMRGLLKPLDPKARAEFLRIHDNLRIIAVRNARTGHDQAVSYADIQGVREAGTLFGFAQGLGNVALGMTPLLAGALPNASVYVVQASTYRELFPDHPELRRRIQAATV
jgi:hypothetical protein